jgi:hypothetical protein
VLMFTDCAAVGMQCSEIFDGGDIDKGAAVLHSECRLSGPWSMAKGHFATHATWYVPLKYSTAAARLEITKIVSSKYQLGGMHGPRT